MLRPSHELAVLAVEFAEDQQQLFESLNVLISTDRFSWLRFCIVLDSQPTISTVLRQSWQERPYDKLVSRGVIE